jgi:hypothetical protein
MYTDCIPIFGTYSINVSLDLEKNYSIAMALIEVVVVVAAINLDFQKAFDTV